MKIMLFICAGVFLLSTCTTQHRRLGETEITKWQFGKKGAVSITYDDGSINQFKIALPIMNKLKIPATFFIITGQIPGSQYEGKFLGRPVKTIIKETATMPTDKNNFYERSSAAGYFGLEGTLDYHTGQVQRLKQENLKRLTGSWMVFIKKCGMASSLLKKELIMK